MSIPASRPTAQNVLLADIGGTNARFALLANGAVGAITHLAVSNYPSFGEALSAYLGGRTEAGTVGAACIAVAGTVQNGRCVMTNSPWVIDAGEVRAAHGFATVRLVNDFEAVAWSLHRLPSDRLLRIGGGQPVAGAPLVALGPGTGLGVAVSVPHAGGYLVLPGEGGHATLPGCSSREDAVIAHLRQRFGHVSAERVLSGSGLENLYEALAALDRATPPRRRAAEITAAGIEGTCPTCRAAIDMFCAMLGTVAGNLALTLGASGGIFIAGGILQHMPKYFAGSSFRARFEEKGRFGEYLRAIPTYLILGEDTAFVGLQGLAEVEGLG
jgi:glucokinase